MTLHRREWLLQLAALPTLLAFAPTSTKATTSTNIAQRPLLLWRVGLPRPFEQIPGRADRTALVLTPHTFIQLQDLADTVHLHQLNGLHSVLDTANHCLALELVRHLHGRVMHQVSGCLDGQHWHSLKAAWPNTHV
jgi:hypothetical protein